MDTVTMKAGTDTHTVADTDVHIAIVASDNVGANACTAAKAGASTDAVAKAFTIASAGLSGSAVAIVCIFAKAGASAVVAADVSIAVDANAPAGTPMVVTLTKTAMRGQPNSRQPHLPAEKWHPPSLHSGDT